VIGIRSQRLEAYPLEQISKFYSDRLEYHNFNHALDVAKVGLMLTDRCKRYGLLVREQVVVWACLLHDAGYHLDHHLRGFFTKEDHSAYLAKKFLREQGIAQSVVDEVVMCIISTHSLAPFNSIEQKIVRAADLWNLAEEYGVFKRNTLKLKAEHEHLTKNKVTMKEWIGMTRKTLSRYLSEKIALTPEYADEDGKSHFHECTKNNLSLLSKGL
jgi:HD superfamily phosphodiesterase